LKPPAWQNGNGCRRLGTIIASSKAHPMNAMHGHDAGPAWWDRRGFLKAGLAGLSWLTPVGSLLADRAERTRGPAQSVILLWLAGGPSQLETFDPHPDTLIAGGTHAIPTAAQGVQLAEG